MISVRKDYPGIKIGRFQFLKTNAFYGGGGTHRHEHRRLDYSATSGKNARSCSAILRNDIETNRRLVHVLGSYFDRFLLFLCRSIIRSCVAKKSNSERS